MIDFPSNPTNGQVFTANGVSWTYNSTVGAWQGGNTQGAQGPAGSTALTQNIKSAAYTTVLGDAGGHILHPSADTTARTWTIDSNANVAYPIGTTLTFVNQNGAGVITIAITSDTMRLASFGTTGSRTLAANGVATALKITATEWIVFGTGALVTSAVRAAAIMSGPFPATWSTTDKTGSITYSNGDATMSSVTNNNDCRARATKTHTSGKYYFEVSVGAHGGSNNPAMGVCWTSVSLPGFNGGNVVGSWGVFEASPPSNGAFCMEGGNALSVLGPGIVPGTSTWMCAVDIGAGKIWFGHNGSWYYGNPATGASPAFADLSANTYAPWGQLTGMPAAITGRFGPAAFLYTPPAGFGPW